MTIVWNKYFETGNHVVDYQHRQLFKAFLAMMEICASGSKDRVEGTLSFLVDFTNKHIQDTIAARDLSQSQSPLPAIDGFQHEKLLSFVCELQQKLKASRPSPAISEVINCFVDESLGNLVTHIHADKDNEIETELNEIAEGITSDDSMAVFGPKLKPLVRAYSSVGFH